MSSCLRNLEALMLTSVRESCQRSSIQRRVQCRQAHPSHLREHLAFPCHYPMHDLQLAHGSVSPSMTEIIPTLWKLISEPPPQRISGAHNTQFSRNQHPLCHWKPSAVVSLVCSPAIAHCLDLRPSTSRDVILGAQRHIR